VLNAAAVVVSIAIAIAVALFGEERRVKPWFVAMCVACACICAGLWVEIHVPAWSLLSARVNMTAALGLAVAALIATRTMSALPVSRPIVALLVGAGALNVATVWATDLYFSNTLLRYPWGVFVGANPRFVANPLLVSAIAGYAVILVARQYRDAHPLEKNRAKYLFAAFTALSLSVLDYLPHFGIAPFGAPVGAVFITIFLLLFGYACLRFRLIVFRDLVGRGAGWMLALAAMALAYALAFEGARRASASFAGPLAGTIAAASVYALLGRAVPDWTQRLLGVREPDYRRAVRDYSDTITSMFDEGAIRAATEATCATTFNATAADFLDRPELASDLAKTSDRVVEVEVVRRTRARPVGDADRYELFLPVQRHGEVVGALGVGRRLDGRMYSAHALESLRTLANLLGMAIANARAAKELAERLALLEARNREVGVLNDELRRQVTDRSRQLAEALQRMGALPLRGSSRLAPGQRIDDRYDVVRELGAGGMGAVYEVVRVTDGRRLALKVLTTATTGTSLARLAREAEVAGKIAHPNLVSIVDVDVSGTGELYLVMELVDGRPLSEARARYGNVEWALGVLAQIANGLAALHAGGVVHRDLKPGNVLLTAHDIAKIADFGIARVADEAITPDPHAATISSEPASAPTMPASANPLTETGAVMGTPLYMAPELAFGVKDAQPSSDVWSFGVLAFELLVGVTPFATLPFREANDARAKANVALRDMPGLPKSIGSTLARALAVTAAERPTAAELAEILARRPATVATAGVSGP